MQYFARILELFLRSSSLVTSLILFQFLTSNSKFWLSSLQCLSILVSCHQNQRLFSLAFCYCYRFYLSNCLATFFSSHNLSTSVLMLSLGYQVFCHLGQPSHFIRYILTPLSYFSSMTSSTLQFLLITVLYIQTKSKIMLDDCFEIQLNITKITEVIFMADSQLLVIYVPHRYVVLQVEISKEINVLKSGNFMGLAEDVKRIDERRVAFVYGNEFHVFDVFQETSLQVYTIPFASVYSEQFHYQTISIKGQQLFLFYKTSFLKGIPNTIYYELHLLALGQHFQRIKKMKVEYPDLRKFGYSCNEIFSYQLSGYEIQVTFLESNITHRIQSIFNLFLITVHTSHDQIQMDFTHNDLENELACYRVCKKKVEKAERKLMDGQKHVVYNQNQLRSLVFKNCYNHRRHDPFVGIFRFRAKKESKILHLMENAYEDQVSNQFKQVILSMVKK